MVLEPVHCPKCDNIDVVKNGKSSEGKQRYLCRNQECCCRTFIQQYTYRGYLPEVKQQITEMAMNKYNDINKQRTVCWWICHWVWIVVVDGSLFI